MARSLPLAVFLLLAGCGAEVAGTAAVGAKTQLDAAQQARETQNQAQEALDAAARLEQRRLEQAEATTRP